MKTVEQQATLRHLAISALSCGLVAFSVAAAPAPPAELRVGDRAPEFSLPTFTSLLAATNEPASATTNVALSAARSTRPVVLIFSSYT